MITLLGITQAMTMHGEETDDQSEAEFRDGYPKTQCGNATTAAEVIAANDALMKIVMKEHLLAHQVPPPLCVEDGVDAPFVAYSKKVDLLVETDEQGRVIVLWANSDGDSPSLNEILPRLAGLHHIRDVTINENWVSPPLVPLTDDGFQAIAGWTMLTSLNVNVHSLTGRAFERLVRENALTHLLTLSLRHLKDADLALKAIENCTKLSELDVGSCDITDHGLKHLEKLGKLEELCLNDTKISGAGLRPLGHLPSLRKLELVGVALDDAGLVHVSELNGLEVLWIGGSQTRITDAGLEQLAKLIRLRHLSLSGSAITARGIEQLAALKNLETLYLEGSDIGDEVISALGGLNGLKGLNLSGTRFTPAGIRQLQKALPNCDVGR
jgi:hypothetical protein